MKRYDGAIGLSLMIVGVLVMTAKPAHAYIDAGTGSYIIQVAAASLFAAVFVIGAFWKKIWSRISSVFGRRDE